MANPATKHPNFSPGNFDRRTHGVYSERTFHPIAEELRDLLLEARPDLQDHMPAVMAWARAEARVLLAEDWFVDHPMIEPDGKVTDVAKFVNKLEGTAQRMRQELGLTPMSQAKLATERAQATRHSFDISKLIDAGAEAIEARD